MFFLSFLTFLKVTHLAGLILGFGGAILTDFTILTRGVLRRVSPYAVRQTEFLSKIVSLGLAILWISGIALIWHNLALHPEYLTNQKLWAKIAIVIVLTFNGVLIHKIILPMLHTAIGRRLFESVPVRKILGMTLLGAISLVSWSIPFVLGKASELNYVTPAATILWVYVCCVVAAWLGMFAVMSNAFRIQDFVRHIMAAAQQRLDALEYVNPVVIDDQQTIQRAA